MVWRKRLIILGTAGLAASLVIAFVLYGPRSRHHTQAPSQGALPAQSEFVLEQSILTRALGIEEPEKLLGLLDTMPAGVVPRDTKWTKPRAALWSLFFSGSMTKLARLLSSQPLIAFYNPIVDVAVIEGCKVDAVTQVTRCAQACAVPGEVLAGEQASAKPPKWLLSIDPTGALVLNAGARMRAFGVAQPAASAESADWQRSFCSRENQSASEKRLIALAMSSGKFDDRRFRQAAGHYVAQAMRTTSKQQSGAAPGIADNVVTVLEHLKELRMSGAIAGAQGGWLVFLGEKRSGWHLAVLGVSSDSAGKLEIESAHLLAISTGEH
jgi:hypothetical protein